MLATSNGGDKSSRKRKSLRLLGTAGFVEGFAIYSRETRCFFCWPPPTEVIKAPVKGNLCAYWEQQDSWRDLPSTAEKQDVSSAGFQGIFSPFTQRYSDISVWGYHYPWRVLHAVETLGAQELRRLICRFYATAVLALCGLNLPSSGTHATPTPNRAHSGSHAETRRVLRVDGDDVFGSGIIDTIDPFQADQPVAVALTEGHRNAVSP